jgi:hypothetical protein
MPLYTLFYGTQVAGEYNDLRVARKEYPVDTDVYQGAYVYWHEGAAKHKWYRMDTTPVLMDDVPKELRLMALLLNI